MLAVYVLVGWEDGVILDSKTKSLTVRVGKYWLGDAGYSQSTSLDTMPWAISGNGSVLHLHLSARRSCLTYVTHLEEML